jgi:phosphatidate cytidylyltransferase
VLNKNINLRGITILVFILLVIFIEQNILLYILFLNLCITSSIFEIINIAERKIIPAIISIPIIGKMNAIFAYNVYMSSDYLYLPLFVIYPLSLIGAKTPNYAIKKYKLDELIYTCTLLYLNYLILCIGNAWEIENIYALISIISMSILISVSMDFFSYIGGKKYGNRKLSKLISPNKTYEGFIIGCFLTVMMGVSIKYLSEYLNYLVLQDTSVINTLLMSFPCCILSLLGDLTISVFKRSQGIKNMSEILPGHGGIMDRMDSIIPVLIFLLFFYGNFYKHLYYSNL